MENLLSAGALTQILENQKPANPVLQIIGYKPMTPDQMAFGAVTEDLRYRLMIGDGLRAHQYCVITNQDLVEDIKCQRLEKWSLIKVTNYQTVDYGEGPPENKRRLIYILNLEVVKPGSEVGCKLSAQQPANPPKPEQPPNPYSNPSRLEQPPNPYNNPPMQQQSINRAPANVFNQSGDTQPQPYQMNPYGHTPDAIKSPRPYRSHDQQTIGIGELTPYIGKWVVKGRVTSKGSIREYNNAKGGGKVFSFTMADKTGEIKITAFNADCERTFPYVEPNKVYVLGRASVKAADKRYTTADFEITLNNDSLLEEITDKSEVNDVPLAKFNFVSLGSLASAIPTTPIDMIGAITEVTDVSTIISKTKNKELKKRGVTIVDMSRHSIEVTVWGEQAENFSGIKGDIFVTKSARIGSYGGRSASAGDTFFINPNIPEVRKMKSWFSNLLEENFTALTAAQGSQGAGDQWKFLDQLLNMEQAKVAQSSGQPGFVKCKATLMAVGKNPVYKCCPTDGCGKKLIDTQNGELKCEKCQQTYTTYKYRYMTSIEIEDCSNSTWITLWDEKAEMVLNMKPEELERHMRMENKDSYERILHTPTFKSYIFTLRSRIETYQGEERVKVHCVNLARAEPVQWGKRLIEEIKKMSADPV